MNRTPIILGPPFIMTSDSVFGVRLERIDRFDQRIEGERRVTFVDRTGTVLKETTMDGFLKLTGQFQKESK